MNARPVRIIVQQPALPKYRVPFFQKWASRDNVSLKLYYGDRESGPENEQAVGFDAEYLPLQSRTIGSRELLWHSVQWSAAARGRCDVLVLSWNVQYLTLIPALLRARCNGIRTILWGHGFSKKESGMRRAIRNTVGRLAHALVFYDRATAERFLADGWPAERIHVAPNALDQDTIARVRDEWLESSQRLEGFQRERGLVGRKNILYIGRIYPENRLDLLTKALPRIRQRHPEVQLLVIGKENEYTAELKAHAEKEGLADAISWLGALYDEQDIAPYMLSSLLFCYPANIGLSIMHAMGYGLPVVTGDDRSSHNPEIGVLQPGVNGVLFKHFSVEDLAETLSHLLDQPDECAGMGRAAMQTMQNEYTSGDMVDGFMKAVDAVLKK